MQRHLGLLALTTVLVLSARAWSQEHSENEQSHVEPSEANGPAVGVPVVDGHFVTIDIVFVDYLGSASAKPPALNSTAEVDEWLQELDGKNRLLSMSRITLGTVEHQQATVHFGEQTAVATPRARTQAQLQREAALIEQLQQQQQLQQLQQRGGGFPAARVNPPAVSYGPPQDFGTIITATPRLAGDGTILVKLQVEKSNISPLTPALAVDDEVAAMAPPSVARIQTLSTLRLQAGHPQTTYRRSSSSPHGLVETVILVTASLDETDEAADVRLSVSREEQ